jgi:hypothetical protein
MAEAPNPPGRGASRAEWRAWKTAMKQRARALGEAQRRRHRAERAARRAQGIRLAGFPLFFVVLGLSLAQLGVMIGMVFVAPVVLVMLSAMFGPKLRLAAKNVSDAGHRVIEQLGETRRSLARGPSLPAATVDERTGVRVEPHRVRVDVDGAHDEAFAAEEERERAEREEEERRAAK